MLCKTVFIRKLLISFSRRLFYKNQVPESQSHVYTKPENQNANPYYSNVKVYLVNQFLNEMQDAIQQAPERPSVIKYIMKYKYTRHD
jgi:hypothetical protein